MEKNYYIYIMTNKNNTVLYTGITNDLKKRVYEHREKVVEGFTKRYNITKLVYYEIYRDVESAILREKQIKGGSRVKKIELIESKNREWEDLYDELYGVCHCEPFAFCHSERSEESRISALGKLRETISNLCKIHWRLLRGYPLAMTMIRNKALLFDL